MSHRKVFFTVIAAVCGLSLGAAADVVPAAAIEGGVNDGLPRPLPSLVQISGVSDDRPNPLPSLVSCVNDGRLCALPSMASLFEIDHLSLLLCHIPKCGEILGQQRCCIGRLDCCLPVLQAPPALGYGCYRP